MAVSPHRLSLALLISCLVSSSLVADSKPSYGFFQPNEVEPAKGEVAVSWNSPEGMKRLARASIKNDFFQLAHAYQPQSNPLFCAVASSVIVLNALRLPKGEAPHQPQVEVERPKAFGGGKTPFQEYTQDSFLNERTERVKKRDVILLRNTSDPDPSHLDPGISLDDLGNILHSAYELQVKVSHADDAGPKAIDGFRQTAKKVLADSDHFLVVNFDGKALGATTRGHVSPLAAYDEATDSLMILDVAGHKNPWYWVPLPVLYGAMHTKDGSKFRGYLVVSDEKR